MARSINDWFMSRQLSSSGDALDDEIVEWQAPWDLQFADPVVPRANGTARAERLRATGRRTASSQAGRKGAGGRKPTTSAVSGPKPPAISTTLRRQIQAAIRENPAQGSKQIAATIRGSGTSVTKAQVTEVRREMHAARRQRAAEHRRAPRRLPTAQPLPVAKRPRAVPEIPLCNACGIRVSPIGTCRCS